jgi:serine phosphatase RsbU (regulator of sigma subunit)
MMRKIGFRSAVVAPMTLRESTIGAITLVSSESGRRFTQPHLELAQQLADRAAVAIENARLYSEADHIARTLQHSLLPPPLPAIPGADLAARYRPAGRANEAGGDFYDVFATGPGSWALLIGDVCGKGAEAAAITALARYTLRAAAMQTSEPTRVLSLLNEAMLRERISDRQFCTVAYVHMHEGQNGEKLLDVCSGGHPLPLVLREDGTVEDAGRPGTLIGTVPNPELSSQRVVLHPRDAVVMFTDGVTDVRVRGGGIFGPERLAELLGTCSGLDPAEIGDRIEASVLEAQEGPARDDIAILVMRATEVGALFDAVAQTRQEVTV